jgi:hypothetical protein
MKNEVTLETINLIKRIEHNTTWCAKKRTQRDKESAMVLVRVI